MAAKGIIIEVRPNIPIDISVPNQTSITVDVPKHKVLCVSRDSMVNITDQYQVDKEHLRTVASVEATSKTLHLNGRADITISNKHRRDNIIVC